MTVTLSDGSGYTVSTSNGAASVTVADDDDPPAATPEISIAAGSDVTEGSDATFTITASPTPAAALTVNVTVSQSGDYGVTTGARTVTIPTSGSKTFTIATTDDSLYEADGSVTVTLSDGTGYTVSTSNGAASVAISDDDVLAVRPFISVSDARAREDAGTIDFTLELSGPSSQAVTVELVTALGTATSNMDYEDYLGVVTIAAGETRKVVSIVLIDDAKQEGNETIHVWLNFPTGGAILGDRHGEGVVVDND